MPLNLRLFAASTTLDQWLGGIEFRCHHARTKTPETPTSAANAERAGQQSITSRKLFMPDTIQPVSAKVKRRDTR